MNSRAVATLVAILLILVLGIAALYAVRTQTPSATAGSLSPLVATSPSTVPPPTSGGPPAPAGLVNACGDVTRYAADGAQMQVTLSGAGTTRTYRLEYQFASRPYPTDIGTLLSSRTPQQISIIGREVAPDTGSPDAVNVRDFTVTRVSACTVGVPVPVTPVPVVVTISGTVNWNHHPQADTEVLLSDTGAPWPCLPAGARARTLTLADGRFKFFVGLPANPAVGVQVCAHGPFEYAGHAIVVNGTTADAGSIDLARVITGLSIRDGDRVPAGPLTITWDAVPEATSYCVAVWSTSTGYQGPACLPGAFGERIATNRFTTPSLRPDLYTMAVAALTDVVIGTRANLGLGFTVGP